MKKLIKVGVLCATLTGCASFPTASEISATAQKLEGNALAYAQTIAKAIQTINNGVQADAPAIFSILAEWGLTPADNKQLATATKVIADVNQAAGDIAKVNVALSNGSLSAVVATTN